MKYQDSVPGKNLVIADAVSHAPSSKTILEDTEFCTEVNAYVNQCSDEHSDEMLDKIRDEQNHDCNCVQLAKYCQDGWLNQNQLNSDLNLFTQSL